MPEWQWEKKDIMKQSPSLRDGISWETECRYRKEGSRFISDVGADLNLKHDTVATGCVYFHRFFMFHSFKDFNRYVAALGCLFLAGKVEETPKKCRDMIRAARQRLNDEQFSAFGEDSREEVMTVERVLLQTIKFDLQVDHPYQYLLKYAKILKGDQDQIQKMVQMAWTFINDSFCTTLCLQWEPEVLAIALMFLASRLSKCIVEDWQGRIPGKVNGRWWDQYVEDMSPDLIEEICHQVLDLYSNSGGKEKQQKTPDTNHNSAPPVSSTSTPSDGGAGRTPNATAPTTPNQPQQLTPGLPASGTPAKTHQQQASAPGTSSASAPPTPVPTYPHSMGVPPPPPPAMAQPAYAFPVAIPPPMPPTTGVPTMPPMPYPPTGPIYATYNYGLPPPMTVGSSVPPIPPPAYAIPAGYGPPGHYDYRAGPPPVSQPTYGTPASIPHAYNVPPPPPHSAMGHAPPPGYAPPPHRIPAHPPPRRM